MMRCVVVAVAFLVVAGVAAAQSEPDVRYRVTFDEAAHHVVGVDVTFSAVGEQPLRVRMSRSSPGRYATHEFAKNVFQLDAFNGSGRALRVTRSSADEWLVGGHDGTVRISYRIFGDHVDGTYMGVDTTHAHLNMPATFLWAAGLEARPIHVTFVPPADVNWRVATQLFATARPFEFTAPNLQYFLDSPTELADLLTSTFDVADATGRPATFRVMAHGDGTQADVDALAALIQRVVREQVAVFREFPAFEPGHYTFILDLVPWADGDAMEHRNSTMITVPGASLSTDAGRRRTLGAVSHEFFHVWNVERIRPADLEPFDFTRANVSCCLWLAEGFTEYYGDLLLARAGFGDEAPVTGAEAVVNGPGRVVRSAVAMSQYAPFADAAVSIDPTDRDRSFTSYYSYGAGLALALDLSLRTRSGGRTTLDDFMRALWQAFGRPAAPQPGYVARPFTLADLRETLAAVAGDRAFSDEFFDRHVEGREAPDYARLLPAAGYLVQPFAPGRVWTGGSVREVRGALEVGLDRSGQQALVPFGTPLYAAGVDSGDEIVEIDGRPATMALWNALGERRPGETARLSVRRRDGRMVSVVVTLAPDPRIVVLPVEAAGATPTPAQRNFRAAWLGR